MQVESAQTFEDLLRLVEAHGEPDLDSRRQKKRDRILNAAAELFIQHGYRRASLDDVAARAGVAKGTVYLYFASKADLLVASLRSERVRILKDFEPVFREELQGAERLEAWLLTVLDSIAKLPLSRRLLQGDHEIAAVLDDLDEDLVRQMLDLKVGFLAPFVAGARGRDEPTEEDRTTARVLMGIFQSSGFFHDEELALGLERSTFHHEIVGMLVAGVTGTAAVAEETP